jgi:hypothetical protein
LVRSNDDARRAAKHQTFGRAIWVPVVIPENISMAQSALILDRTTSTLFLDFDGTLCSGRALLEGDGLVTRDSGRPLFEYAPPLVEMLQPYQVVQIALTTLLLQTMSPEKVISYLPPKLAQRVVDST